jgi:predicted branched-subunit amino acid permease
MFIGLVTLIGVAILLLSPSSESQQIGLVLAIPAIFVVLWRVFRSSQEKNWLTLAFALTLGLVFFAIIEPITQGIFIFRAWRAWQVGEHLVDKDGKVIRGL